MVNKIKQLGPPETAVKQKKEVDGDGEKPHNLTSSLLMNTTLHQLAAGSTEQSSLTINSR
jgi:hypothetical protein